MPARFASARCKWPSSPMGRPATTRILARCIIRGASITSPAARRRGPGSAVAARLTFAALGADTGGSVRMPAHFCGVTGLKTTVGRISRAGAMPLSQSLDTVGPLARTAGDCALLLGLMAGADPEDPTAVEGPLPDYAAASAE